MALSTIEILKRAEELAAQLNSGAETFKKNVLLGLVADFMNESEPDVQRLRRLLESIEQGSGGHIRRGAGYGAQLRTAVRELRKVLEDRDLDGKDFKSLFGWTARLLHVRTAPREGRPAGTTPQRSPERRERPPRPPVAPTQFKSGIGGKGLSTLESLRQQLEGKEKGGKT